MPWNVIRLKKTASTMADAMAHPPGTVVAAEEQTAGQGRLGRRWHSEPDAGLYLSAVLEVPGRTVDVPVITLALGLAVQEAVARVAGITGDLRWPNDLLIGERKCAGILVELHGDKVIAGIGVNVNHLSFPEELAGIATSLRLSTGREIPPEELLAALLEAVSAYHELLAERGRDAILRLFAQASSYVSGRRVTIDTAEATLTGTTDGLDESGFLWIRTPDGRHHLIRAGGLRPA